MKLAIGFMIGFAFAIALAVLWVRSWKLGS